VLGRVLVVVYEAEADAKANGIRGEETFAGKYLWARVPMEAESSASGEGNGAGAGAELEETGEQFKIEDSDSEAEEEEEEEENEIEAGVKAFKASVGKPMVPKPEAQAKTNGTNDSIADPLRAAAAANESAEDMREEDAREMLPSLVDRLFSCTIDLLFCAGFTVPESVRGRDNEGEKINVSAACCERGLKVHGGEHD
jgi:hypothetical protein